MFKLILAFFLVFSLYDCLISLFYKPFFSSIFLFLVKSSRSYILNWKSIRCTPIYDNQLLDREKVFDCTKLSYLADSCCLFLSMTIWFHYSIIISSLRYFSPWEWAIENFFLSKYDITQMYSDWIAYV